MNRNNSRGWQETHSLPQCSGCALHDDLSHGIPGFVAISCGGRNPNDLMKLAQNISAFKGNQPLLLGFYNCCSQYGTGLERSQSRHERGSIGLKPSKIQCQTARHRNKYSKPAKNGRRL